MVPFFTFASSFCRPWVTNSTVCHSSPCGLSDKNNYRENLFQSKNTVHANRLMKAIDKTNFRFGRNVITTADTGFRNNWKMRRNHSSRIDTSSFEFLPTIKAI